MNQVTSLGCDSCNTEEPSNDCCEFSLGRGCEDQAFQACICTAANDTYCCTNGWDEQCIADVPRFGCGTCAGVNSKSCCEVGKNDRAGCDNDTVEACVCAQDAYCCAVHWDAGCVTEVTSLGCDGSNVTFTAGTLQTTFGGTTSPDTNIGWGQSITLGDVTVSSFELEFADGFGNSGDIELFMRIFDADGQKKKEVSVVVGSDFSGGWIVWTDINKDLAAGTYTFAAWSDDGLDDGFNAEIKYVDASALTPSGTAFKFTGTTGGGDNNKPKKMENWIEDENKDINYRVNVASECE